MTKTKRRLVAIHGGWDWADASVDYLSIPAGLDLAEAKADWHKWYRLYCEDLKAQKNGLPRPRYISFPNFLVECYGATTDPDELEVFWDE